MKLILFVGFPILVWYPEGAPKSDSEHKIVNLRFVSYLGEGAVNLNVIYKR